MCSTHHLSLVNQFIQVLSDYIEDKLITSLKENGSFSLLVDESTDDSNKEQLCIRARFQHNKTVSEHYLGLIHVQHTDAASLMESISVFLQAKGLNIEMVQMPCLEISLVYNEGYAITQSSVCI